MNVDVETCEVQVRVDAQHGHARPELSSHLFWGPRHGVRVGPPFPLPLPFPPHPTTIAAAPPRASVPAPLSAVRRLKRLRFSRCQ